MRVRDRDQDNDLLHLEVITHSIAVSIDKQQVLESTHFYLKTKQNALCMTHIQTTEKSQGG